MQSLNCFIKIHNYFFLQNGSLIANRSEVLREIECSYCILFDRGALAQKRNTLSHDLLCRREDLLFTKKMTYFFNQSVQLKL